MARSRGEQIAQASQFADANLDFPQHKHFIQAFLESLGVTYPDRDGERYQLNSWRLKDFALYRSTRQRLADILFDTKIDGVKLLLEGTFIEPSISTPYVQPKLLISLK